MHNNSPVVLDEVMTEAVSNVFKDKLKDHLTKESENILNEVLKDFGTSIKIMATNYINNSYENFGKEYTIKVIVEDKRN